jgi:hypothetical protein
MSSESGYIQELEGIIHECEEQLRDNPHDDDLKEVLYRVAMLRG